MRNRSLITQQYVKPEKKEFSKYLRKNRTNAEKILWEKLRRSQLNKVHFRRQQVVFGFIVDFYCHSKRLIIEIDGEIHKYQVEYDLAREKIFLENDLKVLRFSNMEVEHDLEYVLSKIKNAIA